MTGQADEPDEDDVKEIFSSLKHEFEELPGSAGGNLIKTIIEKRGIRSSARPIYAVPLENIAQELKLIRTANDTDALLFMAANRHLRARGEMDFYAVADMAEQVADAEGKDVTETTSRHFRLWSKAMETKTGSLSIETAAARFIEARNRLFMLSNKTAKMRSAAFSFAEAWHFFRMELLGEHELAAKGDTAERSLDAGRAAQKSKGALKSALITSCYESFAAPDTKETRCTNAGYVAGEIIGEVNEAFKAYELDPIAEGTLKNKLPAIIRDHRGSRRNR